jgi:hypothetical protein
MKIQCDGILIHLSRLTGESPIQHHDSSVVPAIHTRTNSYMMSKSRRSTQLLEFTHKGEALVYIQGRQLLISLNHSSGLH